MKLHHVLALLILSACGKGGSGAPATAASTPETAVKLISQLKCESGKDNRLPQYNNYWTSLWRYEVDEYSDGSKVIKCLAFDFDVFVVRDPGYNPLIGVFEIQSGLVDLCMERNGLYPKDPVNWAYWASSWAFGMDNGVGKIKGRTDPAFPWNEPKLMVGQVLMAPIINIDVNPAIEDPSLGHCFLREF